MRRLFALLAVLITTCLALPATAQAEESIVLGLSQDRVRITTNFDGSELLIFGAVKREAPIIDPPLDVIVTVAGPSEPVTLHHKARKLGIWVNAETLRLPSAPSFYAVATSGPLDQLLSTPEDLRHAITVPRAIGSLVAVQHKEYIDALIRIRSEKQHYQSLENTVQLDDQTLFRTRISLPADLTEGLYHTRVFLLREGAVIASFEKELDVRKVGLERWLYTMSREQSLIYGILSLSIAILAGWLASTLFRVIRTG